MKKKIEYDMLLRCRQLFRDEPTELRRWQEKRNLVQFGFGLMARQFVTPEEWHYFLECYAHDRGVPPAPLREAVDPALERRLRQ